MKSSLFLAATGAVLAMASPVENIDKRAVATHWVVDMVTITVTAGQEPAEPTGAVFVEAAQEAPAAPAQEKKPKVEQRPPPPQEAPAEKKPAPVKEKPKQQKPKPENPPAPSGGSYAESMLYQHNIHRANHSAPAMSWDDELAQYAENIANGCVFEHDMDQGNGGYGQNLASWGSTGDVSDAKMDAAARGVSNQWYNGEMENWSFYDQSDPDPGSDLHLWGHFTQVVWKKSTKLGCATVQCPSGTVLPGMKSWYTVCNYGPPGNFAGQYGNNVLRPLNQKMYVA